MDRAFLYDGDKIVSDDKGRIVVAYEKTVLSMAIADRKPGEGATFHRLNDLRKQQYQLISNEREAMIEQTKLAGTFTPVTHDNLYPKEVMNAVKASQMEQQINEGGNITLPEKTKSKRVAKTNLSRFETDDAPEFIEINKEESTQQKQLKRWE
jgi:hypothetical protein